MAVKIGVRLVAEISYVAQTGKVSRAGRTAVVWYIGLGASGYGVGDGAPKGFLISLLAGETGLPRGFVAISCGYGFGVAG